MMEKKKMHIRRVSKRFVVPRTTREYFAKPEAFQERWDNVAHVVSKIRVNKLSLTEAAKVYGIDPRTVVRLGGTALKKSANGRYVAKRSDSLLRLLEFPTHKGKEQIAIRDSRQASKIGKYWAAVQKYLQTGDSSDLSKFRDKTIKTADGDELPLITDLAELRRLGGAGVVSFENLYGRTA